VQTITIPACIAPGQYLLRGELIALHSASNAKGAQFYMECAQINIQGASASKTPATVSLPGAYSANDKGKNSCFSHLGVLQWTEGFANVWVIGILYNLYSGQKTYTAPGPSVFSC
jgi:hypothetical protein